MHTRRSSHHVHTLLCHTTVLSLRYHETFYSVFSLIVHFSYSPLTLIVYPELPNPIYLTKLTDGCGDAVTYAVANLTVYHIYCISSNRAHGFYFICTHLACDFYSRAASIGGKLLLTIVSLRLL